MKTVHLVVFCSALAAIAGFSVTASEPKVLESQKEDLEICGVKGKILVFPTDNPDLYYYAPLCRLRANSKGEPSVELLTDGKVSVEVVWDLNGIATRLGSELALRKSLPKRPYVQRLALNYLEFETARGYSPQVRFVVHEYSKGSKYTFTSDSGNVYGEFGSTSESLKRKFVDDVKNGKVSFDVTLFVAGTKAEMNRVRLKYENLKKLSSWQNLFGKGDIAYVSRNKLEEVAVDLLNSAEIKIEVGYNDKFFIDFLNANILNAFEKMNVEARASSDEMQSELKKFNIDQGDLKATLLRNTKYDIKNKNLVVEWSKYTDDEKKSVGLFFLAKAFLLDFSTDEQRNVTQEQYRKVLQESGVQYEESGERIIPKSIEVFVLDKNKVAYGAELNTSMFRSIDAEVRHSFSVSSDEKYRLSLGKNDGANEAMVKAGIPIGGIILWTGKPEVLPENYQICDGRSLSLECAFAQMMLRCGAKEDEIKTPNLSGRFVRAAQRDAPLNLVGGGKNEVPVDLRHTHSIEHNHAAGDLIACVGFSEHDGLLLPLRIHPHHLGFKISQKKFDANYVVSHGLAPAGDVVNQANFKGSAVEGSTGPASVGQTSSINVEERIVPTIPEYWEAYYVIRVD